VSLRTDLKPNSFDYENLPLITPNGFREYDARWQFGKELNLVGVQLLGLVKLRLEALGLTQEEFAKREARRQMQHRMMAVESPQVNFAAERAASSLACPVRRRRPTFTAPCWRDWR